MPYAVRIKEVLYGGPPESFCRPKSPMSLARTPTMLRNWWQFWGATLWTLPKWELQCSTFVRTPPSTGPGEQRVSWGGLSEEDYGSCRTALGGSPWDSWTSLLPRAPATAADLPLH